MTTNNDYAAVKAKGTQYDGLIRQEADREGVPYDFMHKLIFNESSFNPTAKSPTGPLGLGQMTELTGKAYGLMSREDRKDTEAYGAGVKMAMQFKNFTMRSVNSRLIRGFHDATKNGRAIDQTVQAVLSTGLAVSGYVAMKYSQAAGMPKDQREKFLQQSLDPNMLAYAAVSRSSHIGAPLGLANIVAAPLGFDQAAMVRSSILPRGPKEQRPQGAMKYSATKDDRTTAVLGRAAEQVPAYGVLASAGQVGYNAFGAAGTDSRRADQEYMTGVFNGLRGLVPNDPISQKLLLMMMEGQGVEIR